MHFKYKKRASDKRRTTCVKHQNVCLTCCDKCQRTTVGTQKNAFKTYTNAKSAHAVRSPNRGQRPSGWNRSMLKLKLLCVYSIHQGEGVVVQQVEAKHDPFHLFASRETASTTADSHTDTSPTVSERYHKSLRFTNKAANHNHDSATKFRYSWDVPEFVLQQQGKIYNFNYVHWRKKRSYLYPKNMWFALFQLTILCKLRATPTFNVML